MEQYINMNMLYSLNEDFRVSAADPLAERNFD